MSTNELDLLLQRVRSCQICAENLPLPPRPVLRVSSTAKVMLIGQAPGIRVQKSGIPWDDPSGDRLRRWLGLDRERFYDDRQIAIMPMGFCYPGTGKSGDLPPKPECAEAWHSLLWQKLPKIELTFLIGRFAINHYLPSYKSKGLAEIAGQAIDGSTSGSNVGSGNASFVITPHPSPRNIAWFKANPWFEDRSVPAFRARVHELLD